MEYLTEESQRINPFVLSARLDGKPLSANKMFTQKRHRTRAYNAYRKQWAQKLQFAELPTDIEDHSKLLFKIEITAGFSTTASDLDNCIKALLDCITTNLQGFDDKQIQEIHVFRQAVPRNSEFIEFILTQVFRKGT